MGPWRSDFLGIAYRYYDLRMNAVPLFAERAPAAEAWRETVRWWPDHAVRMRFVEDGGHYWFVLGSDSQRPESNAGFAKRLEASDSYRRFKKGHAGEAYLRFGTYRTMSKADAKDDALCGCGHERADHGLTREREDCLYEDCACEKFSTFEVRLLRKKKTVTDIAFLGMDGARDDALAWNFLNSRGLV